MATSESIILSLRIPKDLLAELEKIAVGEDRTVAGEVRRLIRRHVETHYESAGGAS